MASRAALASFLDLRAIHAEKAERCKKSFAYFLRQAWHVIEPSRPLIWGIHTDASCQHLQAIGDGLLHRLVANIAPGHGKSSIFSVAFPAWIWTRNPHERFLCASYAMDLAIRDNRNCRMLIESEWYQSLFSDVFQMAADQNAKSFFENNMRGYRLSTAVRGAGTGKRGTGLIIDDPNNAMAGSAEIEAVREWFGRTWQSRLNDQENGFMIVAGQRLSEKDLTSHILRLGGWEHLNLPTEYESARKSFTSIGWNDPRVTEGELLCPGLINEQTVKDLKQSLGSMNYAAQYQQSPVPSDGGIFKKQWLRYFTETSDAYVLEKSSGSTSVLKSDCWRFSVVDLAISSKQTADYTVIQTYDVTPKNELLLIDQIRDRIDNPQQQKILRLLYIRLQPRFIKVENVAYQLAIIQQLRNEPTNVTDLLVESKAPEALDRTIQALSGTEAYLLRYGNGPQGEYQQYSPNVYIARVLGDIGYFKFAVEHQGYCKVVGQPGVDPQRISIPVKEYRPVKDKVSRASVAAIYMENEKVFFRQGDAYLHVLEPEILMFPLGGHDDQIDDLSMACDEIGMPQPAGGMISMELDEDVIGEGWF